MAGGTVQLKGDTFSEGKGCGELEKDAFGWNGAQLPEAVLETSILKAAGRELAVWGVMCQDMEKGQQWPKQKRNPPCKQLFDLVPILFHNKDG